MRRINHLPGTVEACATRHGTLVGPIQTDITGFEELTPYSGGWCGNDVFPGRVRQVHTRVDPGDGAQARRHALRARLQGRVLRRLPGRERHGEVYLGEINPRISGASPPTNLITSNYGGVPLFLFHLLEFMDVDWELDLKKLQKRWETYDDWSQLVLKQTEDEVEQITQAPSSGLWQMREDGSIEFVRLVTTWHTVGHDDEAFYLRVYGTGEYRYKGGDLGVIVTRGRMQTDDRQLTDRAKAWSHGHHLAVSRHAGRSRGAGAGSDLHQVVLGRQRCGSTTARSRVTATRCGCWPPSWACRWSWWRWTCSTAPTGRTCWAG